MFHWYSKKAIDQTVKKLQKRVIVPAVAFGFVTVLFLLIIELDKCQNNDFQVCSQNETFCADFDESTGRYTCRCATGYEASEPVCTPLKGFTQSTYWCIRIVLHLKLSSQLLLKRLVKVANRALRPCQRWRHQNGF